MNAINTYITLVSAHLDATIKLGDVVRRFAPTYNAMTLEAQIDLRSALVKLIARKRGFEYKIGEKGAVKGLPTFERGSAGLSMLNYYLPAKRVVEKTSTTKTRNQTDTLTRRAKSIIRDITNKRDLDKLIAAMQQAYANKAIK